MSSRASWFWPLIGIGSAALALAFALAALALVPVERPECQQGGTVQELLACLSVREPEPFGASDAALLAASAVLLVASATAYALAVPRR